MSLLVKKPTGYHVTTHCFCCGKTRTDELHPDLAVSIAMALIAREHEWPTAMGEYGLFICCPDCHHTAFTDEGSVGRLREAFKARCVRNDQTLGEVGGVIKRAA